jgi:hypothetical protein
MLVFSWIDDFGKLALICLPSFKLENFQTLWVFIWLINSLINQYLANLSIQTYLMICSDLEIEGSINLKIVNIVQICIMLVIVY